MTNRTGLKASLAIVCMAALGLASGAASAQGHGGGHAGGGGGGGHFGGSAGGHALTGHGGYGGGYRGYGGYGGYYRGGYGYGGYRGGYGWRGYGGWGWGLGGLGLGLYFASLPSYYSTYWWGGVPYYYANDTYYIYDRDVGQYQTVEPPAGLASQAQPQGSTDLIAYPKNGQTAEQQARDKYECHHWAVTQTGYDPTQGTPAAADANKRGDYMRAQAACLDGRGYSVK